MYCNHRQSESLGELQKINREVVSKRKWRWTQGVEGWSKEAEKCGGARELPRFEHHMKGQLVLILMLMTRNKSTTIGDSDFVCKKMFLFLGTYYTTQKNDCNATNAFVVSLHNYISPLSVAVQSSYFVVAVDHSSHSLESGTTYCRSMFISVYLAIFDMRDKMIATITFQNCHVLPHSIIVYYAVFDDSSNIWIYNSNQPSWIVFIVSLKPEATRTNKCNPLHCFFPLSAIFGLNAW